MKKPSSLNYKRGFGLIEMLVSVAIFSIVAVMGITALLSLIDAGEKSQSLNSVMQNLNIALETMAREIRTGSTYSCITLNVVSETCSRSNGNQGLQFLEAGADATDKTSYVLRSGQIFKITSTDTVGTPITAQEVKIDDLRFYVVNAASTGNSKIQPHVIMSIAGHVQSRQKNSVAFTLQTTMTQRVIQEEEI